MGYEFGRPSHWIEISLCIRQKPSFWVCHVLAGAVWAGFVRQSNEKACRFGHLNLSLTFLHELLAKFGIQIRSSRKTHEFIGSFYAKCYQSRKLVNRASFSLIFNLRLLSQTSCMFSCTQNPWFVKTKPKKAWKPSLSVKFNNIVVVFYNHAESVALPSNHSPNLWVTLRRRNIGQVSCCNSKLCFCIFSISHK